MKNLFDYFEILRKSKVPFLIVYCLRFYERTSQYYNPISKKYLEDEKIETEIIINNKNLFNKSNTRTKKK